MRRRLPLIAARQCGMFSTAQALADGWTSAALRHACASGRLIRVRVGAYQVADLGELPATPDEYEQARWRHAAPGIAAALTTPGASASHSTAAVLRGLPLAFLPSRACVTVVPWNTGDVNRVHVHRCTGEAFPLPVGWVSCTTTERTILDLGREHGVAMCLVAADYALRSQATTLDDLHAELGRMRRWPGVRAARTAVASADPRSESPLESRSRWALIEHGIPAPRTQVSIGNAWGAFVGRVDFFWEQFGVVGEVDGEVKYGGTDPTPLHLEKRRQELLERLNLEVVRWGSADLRNFAAVAARLDRAFARGRRRPPEERLWRILPDLDPASAAGALSKQRW